MIRDLQDKSQEYMSRNEWQLASELLEKACRIEPDNPFVLGDLAFCHSRLKNYAQAIQIYERLSDMQPDVARWPYGLGYQYYDQQDYDRAITYFDQALKIDPKYIAVLYRKGYALSKLKNKRGQALTTFERCLEAYRALPEDEEKDRGRKHYANAYFQQGKLFLEAGNVELAEDRLTEAVKLKPDDHDTRYNLGKVFFELGRYEQAIDELKMAQRLSPQPQHYILAYLARAYAGNDQLEQAIQVYEKMPPAIQNRAYILRDMGNVYARSGQWEKAKIALEKAVRSDRRNHNGHYELGLIYSQLGSSTRAAQEFRSAIELRQRNYNKPFLEAQQALDSLLAEHPEAEAGELAPKTPPTSPSGRPVGRVKAYLADRGFGFLEVSGGNDLFFHIKEVEGRDFVREGEYLEYTLGEGKKGPQAVKLRIISQE